MDPGERKALNKGVRITKSIKGFQMSTRIEKLKTGINSDYYYQTLMREHNYECEGFLAISVFKKKKNRFELRCSHCGKILFSWKLGDAEEKEETLVN